MVTGGIGWTPKTFWEDSTFDHSISALIGFFLLRRPDLLRTAKMPPSREFLDKMTQLFPDHNKDRACHEPDA